jgi:hypothetical protein
VNVRTFLTEAEHALAVKCMRGKASVRAWHETMGRVVPKRLFEGDE